MSTSFNFVVDEEATLEEAQALADKVTEYLIAKKIILSKPQHWPPHTDLPRYATGPKAYLVTDSIRDGVPCGLDILIERQIYFPIEGGTDAISCPQCQQRFEFDDIECGKALSGWLKSKNDKLRCPSCKANHSIVSWRFDPNWGFGNLAFKFSEWMLTKEFVADVSRILGHRTALVDCMI